MALLLLSLLNGETFHLNTVLWKEPCFNGFKTLAVHIHVNGLGERKKKKKTTLPFFDRLVIKEDFSWRTSVSLDRYILVGRKRSA